MAIVGAPVLLIVPKSVGANDGDCVVPGSIVTDDGDRVGAAVLVIHRRRYTS